jgi:hypothetical protein
MSDEAMSSTALIVRSTARTGFNSEEKDGMTRLRAAIHGGARDPPPWKGVLRGIDLVASIHAALNQLRKKTGFLK